MNPSLLSMMSDHMRSLNSHHPLEDGIDSRVQGTEERTNEHENGILEVSQLEQWRKKKLTKKKNEQSLRDLCDDKSNIHVIGIQEGEEKESGTEKSV